MADHVCDQLLAAVKTRLTSLTTTGAHVFDDPQYELVDADLPALRLTIGDNAGQPITIHAPAVIERTVEILVEGVAKSASDVAGTLRTIEKEVETALASVLSVSGKSVLLSPVEAPLDTDASADQPTGSVTLRFTALLYHMSNAPDALI